MSDDEFDDVLRDALREPAPSGVPDEIRRRQLEAAVALFDDQIWDAPQDPPDGGEDVDAIWDPDVTDHPAPDAAFGRDDPDLGEEPGTGGLDELLDGLSEHDGHHQPPDLVDDDPGLDIEE